MIAFLHPPDFMLDFEKSISTMMPSRIALVTPPRAGFFFARAKKTQGRKNSKLKEKTQNSSKKLKDSANFGVIYSKNQR